MSRMVFDAPRQAQLYCRRCTTEHRFVYQGDSREYTGSCGWQVHPLTLWVLYAVDNFAAPPEVLLPRRLTARGFE